MLKGAARFLQQKKYALRGILKSEFHSEFAKISLFDLDLNHHDLNETINKRMTRLVRYENL